MVKDLRVLKELIQLKNLTYQVRSKDIIYIIL